MQNEIKLVAAFLVLNAGVIAIAIAGYAKGGMAKKGYSKGGVARKGKPRGVGVALRGYGKALK